MNEDDDELKSQVEAEDSIGLSEKTTESHPEDKNKVESPTMKLRIMALPKTRQ